MRLIDADYLKTWFGEKDLYTYDYIIGTIDDAPTVKAEPERKKGKWIPAFNGVFKGGAYWFSCSECGRIVPEVRNGGWNYCPNCGADMRGKEDECTN